MLIDPNINRTLPIQNQVHAYGRKYNQRTFTYTGNKQMLLDSNTNYQYVPIQGKMLTDSNIIEQ